jgi:hypothetical protein
MGAFLRLGLTEGRGKGREVYIAKDQYFHFRGGHFVPLARVQVKRGQPLYVHLVQLLLLGG